MMVMMTPIPDCVLSGQTATRRRAAASQSVLDCRGGNTGWKQVLNRISPETLSESTNLTYKLIEQNWVFLGLNKSNHWTDGQAFKPNWTSAELIFFAWAEKVVELVEKLLGLSWTDVKLMNDFFIHELNWTVVIIWSVGICLISCFLGVS